LRLLRAQVVSARITYLSTRGQPLARNNVSKYPFAARWKRALDRQSIHHRAENRRLGARKIGAFLWIDDGSTTKIYDQLMRADSKDELLREVAYVLASIRDCPRREIAKRAKDGLAFLGFPRPGRGRPRGRVRDFEICVFVETAERAIASTRIFPMRDEAREKYRRNWKRHFRKIFDDEEWPAEMFDYVTRSSPLLLAKRLACEEFLCTLEHVARAMKVRKPA
jgi:hypothetical protein